MHILVFRTMCSVSPCSKKSSPAILTLTSAPTSTSSAVYISTHPIATWLSSFSAKVGNPRSRCRRCLRVVRGLGSSLYSRLSGPVVVDSPLRYLTLRGLIRIGVTCFGSSISFVSIRPGTSRRHGLFAMHSTPRAIILFLTARYGRSWTLRNNTRT